MRRERGSRRLDLSGARSALLDRRFWVGLGLVYQPNGKPAHFEVDEELGVTVFVELQPDGEPLESRLAGLGEGGQRGVWRVPPVGSEVVVGFVAGSIEDSYLLAVLSSGGVPGELDADTLVVKAPKVVIVATDGAVEVGQQGLGPTDGVVHGAAVDPFTGATYTVLGSTSATLRAKR